MRLEGWPRIRNLPPSFQTRVSLKRVALLRMRAEFSADHARSALIGHTNRSRRARKPARNVLAQGVRQRSEVLRVATPATDRRSIERLADLHQTGRPNDPLRVVKIEAGVFPLQPAMPKDLS